MTRSAFVALALLIASTFILAGYFAIPRKKPPKDVQRYCLHDLLPAAYPCEWVPAEIGV